MTPHFWSVVVTIGIILACAWKLGRAWHTKDQSGIFLWAALGLMSLILAILGDAWWRGM